MKQFCLTLLGFVALGFAAVGAFVPVLPTTPFVLLALFCFSGQPKLRRRMLRIPFVAQYYAAYREGRAIPRLTLLSSLLFLWTSLAIGAYFLQNAWLLLFVGLPVSLHLFCLARKKQTKLSGQSQEDVTI